MSSTSSRRVLLLVLATAAVLIVTAVPVDAATGLAHPVVAQASFVGGIFSGIGHAVLGAFQWTIGLASKFILVTLSAFVRMLIPRSWAKEAISVFQWIVAIPDFAGAVITPGGGHSYGFAGVNTLRSLFEWIGIALLPLTLVAATGRAVIGHGDQVAAPIARVIGLAFALVFYTFAWAQGAALVNQLTHLVLSPAPVIDGIHQLMAYATEGVVLGGWQLIDLGLMATLAGELLALIAFKVVVILVGALLYVIGPVMIGLVPTESGAVLARAWISSVITLLALPVAWATLFAVGAVLIGDASTAGPLIAGNTQAGQLLGGVIVAVAGAATLWLCLRAAREAGGLLRVQLGGMLSTARSATGHSTRPTASTRAERGAESVRAFQGRVRDASSAALAAGGPTGQRASAVAGGAAGLGRRGLILGGAQTAGSVLRAAGRPGGSSPAPPTEATPHPSATAAIAAGATGPSSQPTHRLGRAGAVASRMARAGTASWHDTRAPGKTASARAPHSGSPVTGRRSAAPASHPASPGNRATPDQASDRATRTPGPTGEKRATPSQTQPARVAHSDTTAGRATSSTSPPAKPSPRPPGTPSRSTSTNARRFTEPPLNSGQPNGRGGAPPRPGNPPTPERDRRPPAAAPSPTRPGGRTAHPGRRPSTPPSAPARPPTPARRTGPAEKPTPPPPPTPPRPTSPAAPATPSPGDDA